MMNNKRALAAAILLAWLPTMLVPAVAAVWQWSTSPGSNASADPSINWREGQPPSSVNDSARAMMAALAAYRDDISGLLTTTGTASAYSVSTNQGLPNVPSDGQLLAITPNITNGSNPTLTADGGTTYPIQSSAGVAIPAATLILGSPYTLRFSLSNNAWLIRDSYPSPFSVPLGALVPYTGTTSPSSSYIFPAGQCISTTTYAAYWALLGSPSSGSCSGGQFAVLDIRGKVPAALDNLNGTAANLLTSSTTGCGTAMTAVGAVCANGNQSYTQLRTDLPNHALVFTGSAGTASSTSVNIPINAQSIGNPGGGGLTAGTSLINTLLSSFTPAGTIENLNGGVAQTAMPNVPPTIAVSYLLRVL